MCLSHDFSLGSACGTPPFTNFTVGFADCLDYIFYDKNGIEVEQVIISTLKLQQSFELFLDISITFFCQQVVPFPSIEELQAHTALPSIVFPSDHIAIISDLRFKK